MIHVRENLYRFPYRRKNGKPAIIYYVLTKCGVCSKPYYRRRRNSLKGGTPICSKECKATYQSTAEGNKKRKRGARGGPILIKASKHPNNRKGYVPESRLIMEKKLVRLLHKTEIVHHINMDETDNRIANLYLCENNKNHFLCHGTLNKCVKDLVKANILKFNKTTGCYYVNATLIAEYCRRTKK